MALALTGSLTLQDGITRESYLPRICYDNHYLDGTVTASSAQTDHPIDMAVDPFTDTAWIGTAGAGSWWARVSKAGAKANYLGIVAWDLSGITIQLQSSDDSGSTWDNVGDPVMTTDRVLVLLFDQEEHDDWRVLFTGSTPPEVINLSLGQAMVAEGGFRPGFEPPRQARHNMIKNNTTDQGHLVGRSVSKRGIQTRLQFESVTESWVRDEWEPFVDHFETRPAYLVWSPVHWPDEVAYIWADRDIDRPRYSTTTRMGVSLSIKGIAR
ncbi:MAG: hypothetical protein SV201_11700 [Pseudomonadota bacterium]|nr:hypothetical protein [Pseudomonadota bacterium]